MSMPARLTASASHTIATSRRPAVTGRGTGGTAERLGSQGFATSDSTDPSSAPPVLARRSSTSKNRNAHG